MYSGHLNLQGQPLSKISAYYHIQQLQVEAPSLEYNYYIPAIDYYGSLTASILRTHEDIASEIPTEFIDAIHTSKIDSVILDTACVNLSHAGILDNKEGTHKFRELISEFYGMTGTLCAYHPHIQNQGTGSAEKNLLLLCHPVKHRNNAPDIQRDVQPGVKETFFAFLCEKQLITDEQLEQSQLRLGVVYSNIQQERVRLRHE